MREYYQPGRLPGRRLPKGSGPARDPWHLGVPESLSTWTWKCSGAWLPGGLQAPAVLYGNDGNEVLYIVRVACGVQSLDRVYYGVQALDRVYFYTTVPLYVLRVMLFLLFLPCRPQGGGRLPKP